MSLQPGTRLGPYEVVTQIGVGGMGEVYRATDTNLKRAVAIKVLPASVAGDTDRLARFQREAEVLAALNHPNIAAIYGLERSGITTALVMELVEGPTLADRIAQGAIPIDEALPIAKQIAEALEAAHEQGIIHRDLKPANIKVRPDGTVKVLDFGLAKAMEPTGAASANASMSPTITTPAMTQAGMILGTAAYMSPEQARGKAVDKRADIWAFGAVLFEMLTGTRAFPGEDITDTIVSIVSREPDWNALPATTPAGLCRLLARCLKKDAKARMRDIGEVRLQLEELVSGTAEVMPAAGFTQPPPAQRSLWRRAVPIAATAVVTSGLVGAAAWTMRPPAPSSPVMRFALTIGEGQPFTVANNQMLALSPDGTQLVYAANNQFYLRSMSDLEARPIPGTQEVSSPYAPVFSPDGESIAFYSQVDRAIKRIAVSGGAAVKLCPADTNSFGRMSWDGSGILFSHAGKGIMRVSANGGQPEVLVGVKEGEVMYGPEMLPGGEWVLFTTSTGAVSTTTAETWDKAQIVVQSLESSERKTLVSGGSDGRYVQTGHLVYALGGVLFAASFNLGQFAVTSGPAPMVEGIRRSTNNAGRSGVTQFSISGKGSLAFIPGPASPMSAAQVSIGLFGRTGESELLKIPPGPYQVPRMSPDGKHIAVGSDDGKDASIWIYELSGTTAMRRLTFDGQGHNRFPVWSADGQRVAFQSDREGDQGIFWQRADGTGTTERLTKAEPGLGHIPESWAPDGEHLLYNVGKDGTTALWVLSLKDRKAVPFDAVESPAITLTGAAFSPDGRWVAYASRQGRSLSALYVQPFPPTGAKYQISKNTDNAAHPVWSSNGAELFFQPGQGAPLSVVRVTTTPSFTFGDATPVPRPFQSAAPAVERPYDISPDGQHFLGLIDARQTQGGAPAAPQIQVVLNWFEELKAKVPTK